MKARHSQPKRPAAPAFVVLHGSERYHLAGFQAVGTANPYEHVEITIKLRGKTPLPDFDSRPAGIMTYEELETTYGATLKDIKMVSETLAAFDLRVVKSDPGARSLHMSGNVRQMERAFQVKLISYTHETGDYRGRTGFVHIPASLDGIVTAVFGLDARRMISKKKHPTVRRDIEEA